jgi:hypothetical protein
LKLVFAGFVQLVASLASITSCAGIHVNAIEYDLAGCEAMLSFWLLLQKGDLVAVKVSRLTFCGLMDDWMSLK